jgi:hypothetical protein
MFGVEGLRPFSAKYQDFMPTDAATLQTLLDVAAVTATPTWLAR